MQYRYSIYVLFFTSGISGLMYEVVWLRMLTRITGVTVYATATVVAAFMAGLALGSFLFGRLPPTAGWMAPWWLTRPGKRAIPPVSTPSK